jgi:hypothetical protein
MLLWFCPFIALWATLPLNAATTCTFSVPSGITPNGDQRCSGRGASPDCRTLGYPSPAKRLRNAFPSGWYFGWDNLGPNLTKDLAV